MPSKDSGQEVCGRSKPDNTVTEVVGELGPSPSQMARQGASLLQTVSVTMETVDNPGELAKDLVETGKL